MQKINLFLKNYCIFFFIGGLTALSQAPLNLLPLSIIGFSSLFYVLIKRDSINYFGAGHLFGFGYFLVSLSWVGNALLTDKAQFAVFMPVAYLGLPLALGLFYAVSLWIFQKITHYFIGKNQHYVMQQYILFTILLALFDYIRGHIFTGFPWNLPVYTTVCFPILMQPSYLFGIYGYNCMWLLYASAFGLYFLKLPFKKYVLGLIHVATTLCMIGYGYYHTHNNTYSKSFNLNTEQKIIRIIQPNILQKLKWSASEAQHNFNQLLALSHKDLNPHYQYIFIWPETALPFNPEYDLEVASKINDLLDNKHTLFTGKMRFVKKEGTQNSYDFYNSIFKISHDGTIEPVFDKVHLVPFGEYLPLRVILEKIGFSQINFFKSEFSAGKNFTPFIVTDTIKAGGLICYEAIFPQYSHIIKQNKADIIINITNDAWFGTSFGPYQHLVQTQFRAVENNIPIIRSANTGISSFINRNGMIITSLKLNEAGVIDIFPNDLMQ